MVKYWGKGHSGQAVKLFQITPYVNDFHTLNNACRHLELVFAFHFCHKSFILDDVKLAVIQQQFWILNMWHFRGVKTYSDPSCTISWVKTPTPTIYAPVRYDGATAKLGDGHRHSTGRTLPRSNMLVDPTALDVLGVKNVCDSTRYDHSIWLIDESWLAICLWQLTILINFCNSNISQCFAHAQMWMTPWMSLGLTCVIFKHLDTSNTVQVAAGSTRWHHNQ